MSSTDHIISLPPDYNKKDITGTDIHSATFIQFIPGVVTDIVTSEESVDGMNLANIGSIKAIPHFGNKDMKNTSGAQESDRYWPLLRGSQEVPALGDTVLLCKFGNTKYYLGPLTNGETTPNSVPDELKDNTIGKNYSTPLMKKVETSRLEKRLNPKLDTPVNEGEDPPFISNVVPGDMVFEGRHGNSIRIGSRNINPYVIISNGRSPSNPIEGCLDGTILSITNHGTIREHFNKDLPLSHHSWDGVSTEEGGTEYYPFKLADQEYSDTIANTDSDKQRSIAKTFTKPLGRGLKADGESDPDIDKTIYGYNKDQFFLSSDRITFNAREENIFLSAFKHIHVGSGNTMTFSTSNNILTNSAVSVITNTGMFKVQSDTVYIDGTEKIILGNPNLGDFIQNAAMGNGVVMTFWLLIMELQNLCHDIMECIEASAEGGGSIPTLQERIKAFDTFLGVEDMEFDDGNSTAVLPFPKKIADRVLSNKVFLKKH